EGWTTAMPRGLLDILSYKGDIWSVPVNIHRANVLWYNKKIFADAHLAPPATFDEFFKDADALKAKGIVPFALGDKEGWEAGHAFEAVLIAALGADGYRGLWTGTTPWTGPKVTAALEIFKRMLAYANTDHAALTWDGAGEYIMGRKGAMTRWTTDAIVPSVIHGAAASEGWATDYKDAIALFVTSRDTAATQQALAKACVNAGVCK